MQKILTWFFLLIKKYCHQAEGWILCVLMLFCLVFVGMNEQPENENLSVALYVQEKDDYSEDLVEALLSCNSMFDFYETDSENALRVDIQSGKAFCGFVIEEGLADKIEDGKHKDTILYLCQSESARGRIAKETVYGCLLEMMSESLILKYGEELGAEKEEEFLEAAMEYNREYLEGDVLFDIDVLKEGTAASSKMQPKKAVTYPMEGMFISFILLGMLLVNAENRTKNNRMILKILGPVNGNLFRGLQYLAATCMISLLGLIGLILLTHGAHWKAQLIGLPVAVFTCMLWSFGVNQVFRKELTYYVWTVTILLFHIVISPVFFRIQDVVPTMKYLKLVSPVGIYLQMIECFS